MRVKPHEEGREEGGGGVERGGGMTSITRRGAGESGRGVGRGEGRRAGWAGERDRGGGGGAEWGKGQILEFRLDHLAHSVFLLRYGELNRDDVAPGVVCRGGEQCCVLLMELTADVFYTV